MDWSYIFAIVITGLAVVFAVLIFLIVLLKIMGKILYVKPRRKPIIVKPAGRAALSAPLKFAPVIIKPQVDELQVIAVITAAIHAYGEEKGKKLRIVDIRKQENPARSAWGNMGVIENMR
jgi:sodium pump decarboxylase gamma subunit